MAQHHLGNPRHNSGCARPSLSTTLGHSTGAERSPGILMRADARTAAPRGERGAEEKEIKRQVPAESNAIKQLGSLKLKAIEILLWQTLMNHKMRSKDAPIVLEAAKRKNKNRCKSRFPHAAFRVHH